MRLQPEMQWRIDPAIEAARKLPDWAEFHRLCGSGSGKNLCFDHPEKEGRAYTCQAFQIRKNDHGGYTSHPLAKGRGPTVIDAVFDAYRQSGITVAAVETLIGRRLGGDPEREQTKRSNGDSAEMIPNGISAGSMDDDFDCLLGSVTAAPVDDFEELM